MVVNCIHIPIPIGIYNINAFSTHLIKHQPLNIVDFMADERNNKFYLVWMRKVRSDTGTPLKAKRREKKCHYTGICI